MNRFALVPTLALATATAAGLAPATAGAATGRHETNAMRAGIAAFVKEHDAKARGVAVRCEKTTRVGQTRRCTGSFRVERGGKSVRYRLTRKASVFRNTPASYQYNVYARGEAKLAGVPRSTGGLAGFYQR